MAGFPSPFAVPGIKDISKVRVVIYASNQMVHVPLSAILAPLEARIKSLEEKTGNTGI